MTMKRQEAGRRREVFTTVTVPEPSRPRRGPRRGVTPSAAVWAHESHGMTTGCRRRPALAVCALSRRHCARDRGHRGSVTSSLASSTPSASPVLAVGSTVIDATPTPVKEWAVAHVRHRRQAGPARHRRPGHPAGRRRRSACSPAATARSASPCSVLLTGLAGPLLALALRARAPRSTSCPGCAAAVGAVSPPWPPRPAGADCGAARPATGDPAPERHPTHGVPATAGTAARRTFLLGAARRCRWRAAGAAHLGQKLAATRRVPSAADPARAGRGRCRRCRPGSSSKVRGHQPVPHRRTPPSTGSTPRSIIPRVDADAGA